MLTFLSHNTYLSIPSHTTPSLWRLAIPPIPLPASRAPAASSIVRRSAPQPASRLRHIPPPGTRAAAPPPPLRRPRPASSSALARPQSTTRTRAVPAPGGRPPAARGSPSPSCDPTPPWPPCPGGRFKKINRRRTEIATGVYCIQVLSGIYLFGHATYFFQLAGLVTDQSCKSLTLSRLQADDNSQHVGWLLTLSFIGTILSWVLITHTGRCQIYLTGLALLAVLQLLIGIHDCIPNYENRPSIIWGQSILTLTWNFVYGCSPGQVCFIVLCEVSATRVRSKTIGVATAAQATLGIVMTVAISYMINLDQANLRDKIGFFFGGLAAISWVWAYIRVPETGGRTYEELDTMFGRNFKAREFKGNVIAGGSQVNT